MSQGTVGENWSGAVADKLFLSKKFLNLTSFEMSINFSWR